MSAKILDGKELSAKIKDELKAEVEALTAQNINPALAVIIVGDDPASKIYVKNKKLACEYCGIKSLEFALPAETSQDELFDLIEKLNNDNAVSGILCQLPLPHG